MSGKNHNAFIARTNYSSKLPTIATFDIETIGLGGDYLGGMTNSFLGEHKYHATKQSLFNELIATPGLTWFAHNGARFDFVYFAAMFYEWSQQTGRILETVSQGQKIIGIILGEQDEHGKLKKKNQIVIRDSVALVPSSLAQFAKAFAPELPKLEGEIDFEHGEFFDPANQQHMAYLERDVDSLYVALTSYHQTVIQTFGVTPAWTAGATAMRAWMATVPAGNVYFRQMSAKEDFARKGYYGGFVYPGKDLLVHKDFVGVDVKAAYARAMKLGVPTGSAVYVSEFIEGRPGIYEVEVTNVGGVEWPLVPYKDRDGLHWTNENCKTFLTAQEVDWYSKRGYSFKVIKGIIYEQLECIFDEFLSKCESLEYPNGEKADPAKKLASKNMRNSLYGKFAMKSEADRVILTEEPPINQGFQPLVDPKSGEPIEGIFAKAEKVDARYINPHWAAYITMWERLYLFEAIERIGIEHVHYCDTDSIKGDYGAIMAAIGDGRIPTGQGYGNFELDGCYEWFQGLGPKNYHGEFTAEWVAANKLDTAWFGKAKGLPSRILKAHPELQKLAAEGVREQQDFESVMSFKQAIYRASKEIGVPRKRRLSSYENSAAWELHQNGKVTPRRIKYSRQEDIEVDTRFFLTGLIENGLLMQEIADKTAISKGTLSKICNGKLSGKKQFAALNELYQRTGTHELIQ